MGFGPERLSQAFAGDQSGTSGKPRLALSGEPRPFGADATGAASLCNGGFCEGGFSFRQMRILSLQQEE